MSQTTLCRNLGVREGEGHLFEVGILAEDYGLYVHKSQGNCNVVYCISACRME